MKRNPGLQDLEYRHFPCPTKKDGGLKSLLAGFLDSLLALTHLQLTFESSISWSALQYLTGFARQLYRFSIEANAIDYTSEEFNLKEDQASIEENEHHDNDSVELKHSRLRHLELSHALLIPLLQDSPNLEILKFPFYERKGAKLITQAIQQYCPKLRELYLYRTGSNFKDEDIAGIFSVCRAPVLRSVQIDERNGLGLKAMNALCAYSATLELVRIPVFGVDSVKAVQRILVTCPHLLVLDVFRREYGGEGLGHFPAKELLKETWACTKLKVLRVPIEDVYICALDGGERAEELVETETYDHHLQLYNQLAKLDQLEELNVGFSPYYTTKCNSSPLFSLQSGLGMLAGLKRLRILDVSDTVNKIRRLELDWMCKHWPTLERIDGVDIAAAEMWWDSTTNASDESEDGITTLERLGAILTAGSAFLHTRFYAHGQGI
ncbi:hypothetical protein BGX26_006099 [Mortierella sp. AD094]|nr:hypothetical protein BGX26_006099 [Mortierella sp. AD094]